MIDFKNMTQEERDAYNKATKIWEKTNGKVRVEILNTALFNIDKLVINFQKYDSSNKQNGFIAYYINPSKALGFCNKVVNGQILNAAKKMKDLKAKDPNVALPDLFKDMGGMTPEKVIASQSSGNNLLHGLNFSLQKGEALSRTLNITVGDKVLFLLAAHACPGVQNPQGLIVPKKDTRRLDILIGLSSDELMELASVTKPVLEAYFADKSYTMAKKYFI